MNHKLNTMDIDDDEKALIALMLVDDMTEEIRILKRQNSIMIDILKGLGFTDIEHIFYDCPLPDGKLDTHLGYNAPNKPPL